MTTQQPPTVPDTRPLLDDAITILVELTANTRDDQLADPTPCSDYDVQALLGHINGVLGRITALARHESSAGRLVDIDVDPTTIREEIAKAGREAIAAWSDDSLLTATLQPPFGAAPGAIVAIAYCSETLVHSWDLAVATGQSPNWPAADQIEVVIAGMRRALPAQRDEFTPFAAPTTIDDDAPAIERLAAWSGRAAA